MWEEGSFSPLAVRGGLVVGRGFLQPIHMIHSIPHHLPPPSPPVGKSGSLLASINANERTGENERTSDPAIQRAGSGSGRVGEIEKSESDRGGRLGRRRRKRVKRRRRCEELGPSAVCVPPPPPPPPPPQPSADRLLGNPSAALFIALIPSPNTSEHLPTGQDPQELVFRRGLVEVSRLLIHEERVRHPDEVNVLCTHHQLLQARPLREGEAGVLPELPEVHV